MDAPSPEDFFSRYGTTESFFPPPLTDEDMDRLYGDDPGADHKLAQDEPVSSQVAPKLRISSGWRGRRGTTPARSSAAPARRGRTACWDRSSSSSSSPSTAFRSFFS
jgi:hypothetical protein